jgi:hypothetical protein
MVLMFVGFGGLAFYGILLDLSLLRVFVAPGRSDSIYPSFFISLHFLMPPDRGWEVVLF